MTKNRECKLIAPAAPDPVTPEYLEWLMEMLLILERLQGNKSAFD